MVSSNCKWLPLAMAVCLLCGCAAVFEAPSRRVAGAHYLPPHRALALLERLKNLNDSLMTFKGVGKVNLEADGRRRSARIVWAGMAPDRLRIEILGVPGQPAASLALNGEWIYYDELRDPERFQRHKIGNDSLGLVLSLAMPMLSIAIKAPDVVDLFRGRVPLRDHTTAVLFTPPGADGYVLQLEKGWRGVQQRIHFDGELAEIRRVDIFSAGGGLAYRVDFDRVDIVDGYRTPRALTISSEDGDRFELLVERSMANVHVDPSVFDLASRS